MTKWIFIFQSGFVILANQYYIASNDHGFKPGPCCKINEINTSNKNKSLVDR
jgi:hypothetical protein